MTKRLDLVGQVFKWLTIKNFAYCKGGSSYWFGVCKCGNTHIARGTDLVRGLIKSCGCYKFSQEYADSMLVHGNARLKKGSTTKTYRCWASMIQRCENPNAAKYPRYGGRGIKICEQWKTFKGFLTDMGECPGKATLDRINNDGNYEPGNCRWATSQENSQNTSKCIFTMGEVRLIKKLIKDKPDNISLFKFCKSLSERFSKPLWPIYRIGLGKTWTNIEVEE